MGTFSTPAAGHVFGDSIGQSGAEAKPLRTQHGGGADKPRIWHEDGDERSWRQQMTEKRHGDAIETGRTMATELGGRFLDSKWKSTPI